MGFKSKYKGLEIENLLDKMSKGGGGITIVDSVDQLDSNAELGSLASVVEPGSITETLISELPQPDSSIINMDTGFVDATSCPQVSALSIIVPEGPIPVSMELKESEMIYFCSESVDLANMTTGIILGILPQIENNEIIALAGMYMNVTTREQKQWAFFIIQNGVVSVDQAAIDECNAYIKDLYYIGAMQYVMQGLSLTTEQLLIYDNVVKAVAGIPSKAHVYLKGDEWELLNGKDLDSLKSSIDKNTKALNGKSDLIKIKDVGPSGPKLDPNTYYTCTVDDTSQSSRPRFYLLFPEDNTNFIEHIIEINFKRRTETTISFIDYNTNQELPIIWANGIPPVFETGNTYIISIVNCFGVYSIFPNS